MHEGSTSPVQSITTASACTASVSTPLTCWSRPAGNPCPAEEGKPHTQKYQLTKILTLDNLWKMMVTSALCAAKRIGI